MNVVVTGATGFVGSRLVPALEKAGHNVTALVRDVSDYSGRAVEADLLDPASLEGVFDGAEAVYYLVHSMRSGGDFAERDARAASNFREAADKAGVGRVIYLGGLGEEGEDLSEHLRSRREVESILKEGEYDFTSLRAAIIVGDGSTSFRIVEQLVKRLPIMVTPRWVRTPCQPIAVDDIVAYLVGVLEAPDTAGGTYEVGGPEVLSYEDMLRRTARVLGRPLFIIPVPVLSPKLSTYWIDLVTDVPRSIAHPLVHGLKNPVVVKDDSIQQIVEVELTPFDEAVRKAVG